MSKTSDVFHRAAGEGRMTFMPFVTAGDPDLATTARVLTALHDAGADLIELGFPYSDPIADGPVIQASYTRALNAGVTVDAIFRMVDDLPTDTMAPLFAMVSFAIVFRYGTDRFLERSAACGFSGLIIPDLSAEEAGDLNTRTETAGLDLVQLIAPTTAAERADTILRTARGFVYCISVAGTTGARRELPAELADQLRELRQKTGLPLAVGFGISGPDQVKPLAGAADGIIVGSAIVRRIAEAADADAAVQSAREFARQMAQAVAGVAPSARTA